jgi:ribosomal protein S27AE
MLNIKDIEKYDEAKRAMSVKCRCGHSVEITNKYKRLICSWCGEMVYLNKKDEFKEKIKKGLKNGNN